KSPWSFVTAPSCIAPGNSSRSGSKILVFQRAAFLDSHPNRMAWEKSTAMLCDSVPERKKTPPSKIVTELKTLQDFVVRPALRTVPGIVEINTTGGYDKQLLVEPNSKLL